MEGKGGIINMKKEEMKLLGLNLKILLSNSFKIKILPQTQRSLDEWEFTAEKLWEFLWFAPNTACSHICAHHYNTELVSTSKIWDPALSLALL